MNVRRVGPGKKGVRGLVFAHARSKDEGGFTLLELVIVCAVTPLLVGGLAIGLLTMLGLQSSVANRLTDSEDSQMVQANYRNDVQSAQEITTSSTTSPQCNTNVSATQVLGLEWNYNASTGHYGTVVSYVTFPTTSGSTTTYTLVRNECTNVTTNSTSLAPTTSTTLSANLSSTLSPQVAETSGSPSTAIGWVVAGDITGVTFPISEVGNNPTTVGYQYTLVASPPSSSLAQTLDSAPPAAAAQAGCGYAAAGSGTYASSLCFIDFTKLTANNDALLVAATSGGGCVELSVALPGGSTLYFCLQITGGPVCPRLMPTYSGAFLGNSYGGVPFYSNVSGLPAIYQIGPAPNETYCAQNVAFTDAGGTTTVNITGIQVVAPDGNPATGWEFMSADAESTDAGEWTNWQTDKPMTVIPNGQSADSASDPEGNACVNGTGVTGSYTNSNNTTTNLTASQVYGATTATAVATDIECWGTYNGVGTTNNQKNGTLMVESAQPTSMTITMFGSG
ncbi:MAG: hypothetical protein JWM55_2069, partial [Acidimicrobiaceae bacterium]|nr:hypothetical protein [Acidimicrobiaceae bacterium]